MATMVTMVTMDHTVDIGVVQEDGAGALDIMIPIIMVAQALELTFQFFKVLFLIQNEDELGIKPAHFRNIK